MSCKIFPEQLPQRIREDPRLSAEVRLYELLRAQMPFGWTVFYDVAWLGLVHPDGAPRDGQIDFIVAHPGKGVLLIEVKGGWIRFDGSRRQWISTDRHGMDHDIDPFAQVRSNKYGLLNKLKTLPSLRDKWIQLAHAVCFPTSVRPQQAVTADALPEIIIGSNDLERLSNRVENILAFSHGAANTSFEHGELIVRELTKLLATSVQLSNPLALQALEEHREIIRLTESQMRVLSVLKRVRRAAVGGAAGSGKTFLAVEKAKRLASEGFATLLTCYTNPLAELLKTLVEGLEQLDVFTVHELARRAQGRNQLGSGSPAALDAPTVLFDAASRSDSPRYDAIVVDEGQDLTADWWLALESCLREGKDSVFYVFHDTHQTLTRGGGILPEGMTECALEDNVRNTQAVCDALRCHYRGEVPIIPRGPAGRRIEQFPYNDVRELPQLLRKVLSRLLTTERFQNTDLVVLTLKCLDRSALVRIQPPGPFQLVSRQPNPGTREVQLATVEEFKGLERAVVIVVELDEELPREEALRAALCYVAFSRPRNHLVLMGQPQALVEVLGTTSQR